MITAKEAREKTEKAILPEPEEVIQVDATQIAQVEEDLPHYSEIIEKAASSGKRSVSILLPYPKGTAYSSHLISVLGKNGYQFEDHPQKMDRSGYRIMVKW